MLCRSLLPLLRPLPRLPLHGPATARPASELATLRKATGYSLSICKKALGETGNDVVAAEQWLQDQAQQQGWAKAQKLQGRNTSQGLLGLLVQQHTAALVELNCETDFVARNQQFVSLLGRVATCCTASWAGAGERELTRVQLSGEQAAALTDQETGKTVGDLVALSIGSVGENMGVGEARVWVAGAGLELCGLCHPAPAPAPGSTLTSGRYAALLAYRGAGQEGVARQICQHIVGLAPTTLSDEEDKENSLLHQQFLLDESMTVGQLLQKAGIEIADFIRVEVGRNSS